MNSTPDAATANACAVSTHAQGPASLNIAACIRNLSDEEALVAVDLDRSLGIANLLHDAAEAVRIVAEQERAARVRELQRPPAG